MENYIKNYLRARAGNKLGECKSSTTVVKCINVKGNKNSVYHGWRPFLRRFKNGGEPFAWYTSTLWTTSLSLKRVFLFFSFLFFFHLSFFSRHRFNPVLFSFENVNQRCNSRETNSISALCKSVGLQLRRQARYFNCDFAIARSWF